MKLKNLLLSATLLAGFLALASCDDDKDDKDNLTVGTAFTEALQSRFPNVTKVKWESKPPYTVADFRYNGKDTEAWFNDNAIWVMTQTELGRDVAVLPTEVYTTFTGSEYASYTVDDIDKYERIDVTFYKLDLEKKGQQDVDMFIKDDGQLLQTVTGEKDYEVTPDKPFIMTY